MKNTSPSDELPPVSLPPKTSERLLIDRWPEAVGERSVERVLVTSNGRAQLAQFVAERYPSAAVECYYLDAYLLGLAERALDGNGTKARPANLSLRCSADLVVEGDIETGSESPNAWDVVALPLSSRGDAELTREQLQQAYRALRSGGLLLASTDNPRDVWLHEMAQALGGKVRRFDADDGAIYVVQRTGPLKRARDFQAEFAFRDGERLLSAATRPGVFSHRRVDPGARRLMEAMTVAAGDRVLDIGCGWGTVGLAAACRADGITVEAIDSNARAVACTRANAKRNHVVERFEARLEPAGKVHQPGTFDLALGNPPYYADFRIAELFVSSAFDALQPGGRLLMVTKLPEWFEENLPERFSRVKSELVKTYTVFYAVKP
ncbi:MAG: methyltransferase [Planctomycetia bacterium]|nr:methyltransferase [Planctomycetia bacterium]